MGTRRKESCRGVSWTSIAGAPTLSFFETLSSFPLPLLLSLLPFYAICCGTRNNPCVEPQCHYYSQLEHVPEGSSRRSNAVEAFGWHLWSLSLSTQQRTTYLLPPSQTLWVRQLLAASGPGFNHGSPLVASAPSCLGLTWFSPAILYCLDPLHGSGVYSCSPNPHHGV